MTQRHTPSTADVSAARPDALLSTKLYVPRPRPQLLSRQRLIDRLDECVESELTLVSAPAGFGKTTLLAEWSHRGGRPVVWVSLDEGDNDPARFWRYIIAALQRLREVLGEEPLALLRSPQPPPIGVVLTLLINEIAALPEPFALVLDDYHVIEAKAVHDGVAFLLDQRPGGMHLVIGTRSDPPLPLARMRARGQLAELRASDLRFTAGETAAFLNEVMELDIVAEDVAALEARTEGWVAGLQLAALSMKGREDAAGLVRAFAGSHRHVLDFLVEEVLERQPEGVRDFLLQTSILGRLNGALCDAVTGGHNGQAMLETVEKANLFLSPLDEERNWYRYHHLFADVLRHRLRVSRPDRVRELHRKACEWHERHGLADDAIRHALAGGAYDSAARLIEGESLAMLRRVEMATLRRWVESLPEEAVLLRPGLCLSHAWTLLLASDLDAAEARIRDAERALRARDQRAAGIPVDDGAEGGNRDVRARIANLRAYIARRRGDVAAAIALSHWALELIPEEDSFARALAALNLGIAYAHTGDVEAARAAFDELAARSEAAGSPSMQVIAVASLARLQRMSGKLREADATARRALQLGSEGRARPLPTTYLAHLEVGKVLRRWNDLDAAGRHLEAGIELARRMGDAESLFDGYMSLVRVRQARGDVDGALGLIREIQQLGGSFDQSHLGGAVAAYQAMLGLTVGDLAAAERWVRGHDLEKETSSTYLREVEHLAVARVLLALGNPEQAVRLVERLLVTAESQGRNGSVIEILSLQAVALQALGDTAGGISTLARALSLAEPEGHVRVFADEGPPMARLLSALLGAWQAGRAGTQHDVSAAYVRKLMMAIEQSELRAVETSARAHPESDQPLAEPLSGRELEVLVLLAAGRSNKQIAQELIVTVGTVKTHISNIYGKLDVGSRTQAVARARELGLL